MLWEGQHLYLVQSRYWCVIVCFVLCWRMFSFSWNVFPQSNWIKYKWNISNHCLCLWSSWRMACVCLFALFLLYVYYSTWLTGCSTKVQGHKNKLKMEVLFWNVYKLIWRVVWKLGRHTAKPQWTKALWLWYYKMSLHSQNVKRT